MKKIREIPSYERLNEMFFYDQHTGFLTRKMPTRNGPVGSRVGGNAMGYLVVWVDGIRYLVHRVVWLMHYGLPVPQDTEIDHKNGIKDDNRIENLRLANSAQNMQNQGNRKNTTSTVRGVNFDKQTGKWRARIEAFGKSVSLGRHETFLQAVECRKNAEREFYGEFAPCQ